jgi:hypothetical protein
LNFNFDLILDAGRTLHYRMAVGDR